MNRVIGLICALCCFSVLAGAVTAHSEVSPEARMWDVVQAPSWQLTVRSVERLRGSLPGVNGGAPSRPTGQFAVLVFELRNLSSEPQVAQASDFVLRSSEGNRWPDLANRTPAQAYAIANGFAPFGGEIGSGETETSVAVFDIEFTATQLVLDWLPAGNRSIRIDECHCNLPSPSSVNH
jgi:hypothetical protein